MKNGLTTSGDSVPLASVRAGLGLLDVAIAFRQGFPVHLVEWNERLSKQFIQSWAANWR
jgi:hypothetical protein